MIIQNKDSTKYLLLILPIFILASILATGCATKPKSDPLAGWNLLFSSDYKNLDKAIIEDSQSYIAALPRGESKYICFVSYLEDGKGNHAVKLDIALNGTDWSHVLFYDKDNKRVRVIKYVCGHYAS